MEERGHTGRRGSGITRVTGSTASYTISTNRRKILFRANVWYHQQQGSHSDKRAPGRKNVWKEKKKSTESEKEETAQQEAEDKHHRKKKHNNKWPTSCSKVGKVSMTPSLWKNVIPKKKKETYCSWSPVCPIAQASSLNSRTDNIELSFVFTWKATLFFLWATSPPLPLHGYVWLTVQSNKCHDYHGFKNIHIVPKKHRGTSSSQSCYS